MFAAFWPFDWSFDGFLFIMLCLFCWTAWSVKETTKSAVKAAQKMAENETVQEAGWSVFHAWLGSVFKKH